MYGKKLLQLAKLVGLNQSDIARHLGVNRVQVHHWASGTRPIPVKTREPLMKFLYEAVQRYLAEGWGDVPVYKGGVPGGGLIAPRAGDASEWDPPPRRLIEDLLFQCMIENLELRGMGPSATVPALALAMEKYQTMDPASLRKAENAEALRALSVELLTHADLLLSLGPLQDLVALRSAPPDDKNTEENLCPR